MKQSSCSFQRRICFVACALLGAMPLAPDASAGGLHSGDTLAICGDSITEQKMYSVFIEDYLLMCQPATNLAAHQFALGR
jgi:hypothetical protein